MAIEHGLDVGAGSPSTEDPDPGTQHMYGVIWETGAASVLQQNHAFNRVWYAPSTPSISDELGWAVWDEAGAALVTSVTIANPGVPPELPHGWNPVGDLGSSFDLPAGSYVVFGRWVGKSPYDLSFGYPADGSGGPAPGGHITLTNGTFGFGALASGPRAGGGSDFDLRAWADAALSFGGAAVQASGSSALSVDLAGAAVRVRARTGASPAHVDLAGAGRRVREAAGALGLTVAATGSARRVRSASGAPGVAVALTGSARRVRSAAGSTPVTVQLHGAARGKRVRPGTIVVGGTTVAGIVPGTSGPGIIPG